MRQWPDKRRVACEIGARQNADGKPEQQSSAKRAKSAGKAASAADSTNDCQDTRVGRFRK
jgi:hypothetical protein